MTVDTATTPWRSRIVGRLNAHHIQSWADEPSLRFDLENGVTLCIECHAGRHPDQANLIRKAKYHDPGVP